MFENIFNMLKSIWVAAVHDSQAFVYKSSWHIYIRPTDTLCANNKTWQ